MAVGALSLGLLAMSASARADITIDTSVGGAPTGGVYINFDNLRLGASGGLSDGITVSFTGNGQTVQGSRSGVYAAPYLSHGNGALFGDSNDGPDTTRYLTTGTGSVTLALPGPETYIGLLWGSVDSYNTLSLYNGSTLVGTITGSDVTANADGNQGVRPTYYVNINSTDSFNKVVATSTSFGFELDNFALNASVVPHPSSVPEPSSLVLALIGGIGAVTYNRMRRKGSATGNEA